MPKAFRFSDPFTCGDTACNGSPNVITNCLRQWRQDVDLSCGHCYVPVPIVKASPNVCVNNKPFCRVGDPHPGHCCPGGGCHGGAAADGSPNVYANENESRGEAIIVNAAGEVETPMEAFVPADEPVLGNPGGTSPSNAPDPGTGTSGVLPSTFGGPFAPKGTDNTAPVLNSRTMIRDGELGAFSKQFESNGDPGAIGFDGTGGYSYGEYQIATKTGTFREYMNYLKENDPELYDELQAAGGADAAERGDPAFKQKFQDIMRNNPDAAATQHDFIQASHYEPQRRAIIQKTGIDVSTRSKALQDTVWSTSVQHRGQTDNIVARAINRTGKTPETVGDRELIAAIYDERAQDGGNRYFPSSTPAIKMSVVNRFSNESNVAVAAYDAEVAM